MREHISHFAKSVFEKVTSSWPASQQGGGSGDGDEGFGDGGELLVIADKASVLEDPGECPLHDPAPRQHLEGPCMGAAADDLEGDMRFVGGPAHEATGVATISEDAGDKGIVPARALERQLAAVTILDVGAVDVHGEEPTIGVGQDVALAPGDLLARIVALATPF